MRPQSYQNSTSSGDPSVSTGSVRPSGPPQRERLDRHRQGQRCREEVQPPAQEGDEEVGTHASGFYGGLVSVVHVKTHICIALTFPTYFILRTNKLIPVNAKISNHSSRRCVLHMTHTKLHSATVFGRSTLIRRPWVDAA